MGKKLFDYVIGNPPYNENFENSGDNGNFAKPVYNQFMDAVDGIAEKVELIHPARFLFNAGSTPKAWNEKMLNDPILRFCPMKRIALSFFRIQISRAVLLSLIGVLTRTLEQLAHLPHFRNLTVLSKK